jgi:primosomal protein N' (replication factor Y)
VIFSHKNAFRAKEELNLYLGRFMNKEGIEVIGFGECNIFKIANKYRYELLLRSKDTGRLLGYLHSIKSPLAAIDMDSLH